MKQMISVVGLVLLVATTIRPNGFEETAAPGQTEEKKKVKKQIVRQQPPQRPMQQQQRGQFQQPRSDIVTKGQITTRQTTTPAKKETTKITEEKRYAYGTRPLPRIETKKQVAQQITSGQTTTGQVTTGGYEGGYAQRALQGKEVTRRELQTRQGTTTTTREEEKRRMQRGKRKGGYKEEHHGGGERGAEIGLGIAGALLGGAAAYEYGKEQAQRPEYEYGPGYDEYGYEATEYAPQEQAYGYGYEAEEGARGDGYRGEEYGYQEGSSVRGGFGYQRQVPAYDACLMRSTFSTLWAEQAVLLRLFIMASLNHTDTATIMNQFSENQRSLGDLFTLFYGQEIGHQFVTLLQEYTSIVQEVVAGSLQNRRKQEFVALWDHYADKMADFLVARNNSWSKSSMVRLFQSYGSLTSDELFAIVQRDCKTDSALLVKSISKSQEIADKLASGIITQFPQ